MEAVPSCLDIMIPVAEKKDIKIETFLPSGLRLRTDPDILKTVLRNLLSNAIKFTPPGGHIKLIGMKLPGNYAKVSVSDTGIGMDAVTLDNLFSLEGLSNRPGTEGEPSSGLGLLLCRDLLKLQNIEMEIVSTAGRGTEISFELPTA